MQNSSSTFAATPQSPKSTLKPVQSSKPTINVSKIVKDTCSVYITKGRINNTASKLLATKKNCVRVAR